MSPNWMSHNYDIAEAERIVMEVWPCLSPAPTKQTSTIEIRKKWQRRFQAEEWAAGLHLRNSNLTIGYFKNQVGLCVQLGNVCRAYADLLKLEALFKDGITTVSVLVVPSDDYSAHLGSNHASFTRMSRDIEALSAALTGPMILIERDFEGDS